ncbi:MAG: hypothetical protein QG657_648 [Acidobacteriota bacterium]|nr:hypothetical protein [Acidobacteriota bacterium]
MDLAQRISKLTPAQQKLLELRIKKQNFDIYQIPLSRENRKDFEYLPLSLEQEPMWFMEQYEPNNATYDIVCGIKLEGDLNKEVLEKSINEIVKRHEILRTVFVIHKDKPVQEILPSLNLQWEYVNWRDLSKEEQNYRLEQLMDDQSLHNFDLIQGPLIKTLLFELDAYQHIFFIAMHHLISDVISTKIFFEELAYFYNAFTQGKPSVPGLSELPYQYADYSCWQRKWFLESLLGIEIRKKQEEYWLNQFKDEVPVLSLPTDFPRPSIKTREADQVLFKMHEEEIKKLIEISITENTTVNVILLTILNIFLAKICGQEDIVVGTPISSRNQPVLNDMIGIFTRLLVLRNYPCGDKAFNRLLSEVNAHTLEAYKNQEYQYEELVGKILMERDLGRNPLFDVLYNFSFLETEEIKMQGLNIDQLSMWKSKRVGFDIYLHIEGTYKELFFKLLYCTKLFKEETIWRFISYFKRIMDIVGKQPAIKISEIEIIPEEEKRKILYDFNNTKNNLSRDKDYPYLFDDQVYRTPDRIALSGPFLGLKPLLSLKNSINVVAWRQRFMHLTYRELNGNADRLAFHLKIKGVKPDKMVAVMMERSIEMMTGILGIFKAGGAYLPIDPDYPRERIDFILKDSETINLLTADDIGTILGAVISETNVSPQSFSEPDRFSLQRLTYVIYTSGTTGKPKGVMIHQLGMLNHLYAMIHDLSITSEDKIAQTASACFDISVWQFLTALLVGGTTTIIDKMIFLDLREFLRVLQLERITILELVPSQISAFLEVVARVEDKSFISLIHLRWMISIGEALSPQLVREWYRNYPSIPLVNAYGPTETSDNVTHYFTPGIPSEFQTTVPIGKPLQNLRIYILDKYLSLCPIGVVGEICVAGIGVGKGYWKNREKTDAVFIPNPHLDVLDNEDYEDYKVLYKTGDLGYFRADGNIECLGRLDSQVKIRGNRIELGEIESQLLNHKEIKEAAVIVKTTNIANELNGNVNKYLCAYFVPEHEIQVSELKEYLSGRLPEYMIPSYFISLKKLPLTPNGKIDRKALPEPKYEHYEHRSAYCIPTNKIEIKMAEIWSELLAIEKDSIGIDDNFFGLGGHSLNITILVSMIQKEFNSVIPLLEAFKNPTIRALSAWLQTSTKP